MSKATYTINLTAEDIKAIGFAGHRYGWSREFPFWTPNDDGTATVQISETEAWEWLDAIEQDINGGHGFFPLLNSESELHKKLLALYGAIV